MQIEQRPKDIGTQQSVHESPAINIDPRIHATMAANVWDLITAWQILKVDDLVMSEIFNDFLLRYDAPHILATW